MFVVDNSEMKVGEWLSTGEVAASLGVSRQHVVDLCDRGDLAYTRFGKHRRVRTVDLERLTKTRLTYEQERSLWLHRVILGELMLDPEGVVQLAKHNVARWKEVHRPDGIATDYLLRWEQMLDGDLESLARVLTGVDEDSCELRQNSPFAGVLSEERRLLALHSFRTHWRRENERHLAAS